MTRSERKRQAKQDEKHIARGIDTETRDPEPTAAMARQLHALLESAKREGKVDGAVEFLHAKVDATLQVIRDSRLACSKGCSHCCHAWVSVTAPEVLFVAKRIQRDSAAAERVKAAFLATKDFDFVARARHPHPCPMLETEFCSVYDARPNACRMAASVDAGACGRSLRLLSGDTIPIPVRHLRARGVYEIAVVIALRHAGLPHHLYEFNAALTRSLEHPEAEKAWLSGDDIFWDVRRDPTDVFANPAAQQIYRHAFGVPRTN